MRRPLGPSAIRLVAVIGLLAAPLWAVLQAVPSIPSAVPATSFTWSSPVSVDKLPLTSVSCPTTSFCMAVDSSGNTVSYNGSTWTHLFGVDTSSFRSVSCPSSSACVAVDSAGNATSYSGSIWTGSFYLVDSITPPLTSVSCVGASFCIAVDGSGNAYVTTTGVSGFGAPTNIDSTNFLTSVSCATVTNCAAVDSAGNALFTTNGGTSWTSLNIDSGNSINSVSCSSASLCMAVDSAGNGFYTINSGGTWTLQSGVDGTISLNSISCPSVRCVAVDSKGNAITYNGSSWSAPVSIDGTSPIDSISCPASGLPNAMPCVAVDNSGNAIVESVSSSWSPVAMVDPGSTALPGVSCASSTLCMAVDAAGNAITYNGSIWLSPLNVDGTNALTSVSCASATTFCAAVDGRGYVATYNAGAWSGATDIDGAAPISSVSCVSATFCVAVDRLGQYLTYNGSTWSAPVSIAVRTYTSVTCLSTIFCMAVDASGDAVAFNGSNWTTLTTWANPVDTASPSLTSISCPSTSSCLAVDSAGNAVIYSAGSWAAPAAIDAGHSLTSVSCSTGSICIVVDNAGNGRLWNSGTWNPLVPADSTTQINSVSWIPAASSWVAVDNIDDSVTFNGSTWSTQTNLEPIAMSSDSCVSAAFCMAVDHAGNVLSYNGTTWSAPASIDATHAIDSVSCVSTSFCVAVDGRGYEMTWGGLAWSAPTDIDASIQLNSVSCVSTTFCMAVDGGGNALEYNGSTWSAPGWSNPMDVSHIIISVSCESVNLCAAVDLSGDAMMFYGTSWVSFTPDTANQFESVSCPLSSGNPFCMAVDNAGNFTTFSGSSWSTPATVGTSSGLGSVSCTSPSFCVTTDAITNAYYFDGVSWLIQSFGASQPAVSKLSCIHGGFCAGIAFNGTASQRTTVSSWAAPAIVDTGSFTAVSCPSASECVAVDGTGDIATSNNPAGGASTWSVASNVSTNGGFTGVSCPSTTLCIAVSNRYAFWGNPSVSRPSWVSMNITGVGRLQGIDCISTTLCVAVDNSGDALFSTTPTVAASWSAPLSIDGTTALASISCDPTGALCMALDIGGSTVSSTNVSSGSSSTWTAANSITSLSGTSGLSCPSVTFCIAIDSSGQASYTLNPSAPFPTWSTAVQIESTAAITMGINCASVTSCVAVDSYGNVVVTENPQGAASAWAVTSVYSTSTGFAAVSCANTSFCAAVDQAGNVSLGIIPAASPAPTPPTTTYSLTLSPSAPTLDPGGSVTFSASLTQTTTNAATGTSTSGPVGAASISFDISSGPDAGQTFTAITNSSGMASFTYVNSGGPGVDTVTAGATNSVTGQVVIATATVTFAGQDSLTLSPTSQGAVADTSVTVSAAALDPSGAPLSGASVNFSVASGPDAGQSAIATTDSHGAATFSLSAAKAGTDSVTATLSDPKSLATVTSNQVAVNWAAPVVISPSSPSSTKPLLPGTPANLSVTLTSPASALIRQHAESLNSPGQALPKAPSALHDYLPNAASGNVADVGIPVTFSVASGPNIGQGATETTDSAGTATWSYSDTGGPGTDGVTASFTDSAGLPHSISMSVLWAPAPTTTTSTVTTLAPTTTTSPIAIVAPTTSMPSGQASTTNYSSPTTSPPAATSTGGTSSQGGSTTTVAPKVPTSTTSPGVSNHRKSSQSTTTIAPSLQALGLTPTAPAALNGNLATPQMVKALVQAGQRGPAMGYNKGYGLGSAGGPPGPVPLAQSIPSPTEAMHSFGKTAGQNSILTFLLIFLIGLPSLIFNSTLKEHHGNIASTHGAIRRFIDRIEAWLAKLHTAALLGFFAVIGSLLYAVVDPTFGFNLSSLAEIVGYVGAIILSTGVTEIARGVYVHRKFKKIGDLRAFPLGIVMAAAFDVFSRVAHFEPGFVFGILAAMVFRVEPTGEEDGRSIALSSIWLMGVSTVCWIVWIPVKDAVIGGNHNFLVLCVDALLSFIWICGLQSLFFGLIPVKSMDGDTVFKWSKITWALIYLIVTFVFVQFIIHPSAAGYGGNSHTSLIPLLSMFFAATVAAAVFWTYTHFKFGNRSTKTDEGKIAVDAIT